MFEEIINIGQSIITVFSNIGSLFLTPIEAFGTTFTPLELMFGAGLAFVLSWILLNFFIPN